VFFTSRITPARRDRASALSAKVTNDPAEVIRQIGLYAARPIAEAPITQAQFPREPPPPKRSSRERRPRNVLLEPHRAAADAARVRSSVPVPGRRGDGGRRARRRSSLSLLKPNRREKRFEQKRSRRNGSVVGSPAPSSNGRGAGSRSTSHRPASGRRGRADGETGALADDSFDLRELMSWRHESPHRVGADAPVVAHAQLKRREALMGAAFADKEYRLLLRGLGDVVVQLSEESQAIGRKPEALGCVSLDHAGDV
jgi:hypothetical protein